MFGTTTTAHIVALSLAVAPLCACVAMATGDDPPSGAVSPSLHEFAPSTIYTDSSCDSGQEIYLLGNDGAVRALEPTTLAVRDFPALRCPTTAAPNSMAVDSKGEAWVGFVDGTLFRATPSTGECHSTAFDGPKKGWTRFGMGVIAQRGGKDALYIFDNGPSNSLGLATVDLQTERLVPVGPLEAGDGTDGCRPFPISTTSISPFTKGAKSSLYSAAWFSSARSM